MIQNNKWAQRIAEWIKEGKTISCVDEVAMSPPAGPIYTCAVVLYPHKKYIDKRINDSKKLKHKIIYELAEIIKENVIDYSVGISSVEEINRIQNINTCRDHAFKRAIIGLKYKPDIVLVDGNRPIKGVNIEQYPIIKGDEKVLGIACASIIAKKEYDYYMIELHKEYPEYDWKSNKGYRSPKHLAALTTLGITEHHRIFYKDVIKYGKKESSWNQQ